MTLLITDTVIVTGEPERRILDHAAIAIEADRIIAIGPTAAIERAVRTPRGSPTWTNTTVARVPAAPPSQRGALHREREYALGLRWPRGGAGATGQQRHPAVWPARQSERAPEMRTISCQNGRSLRTRVQSSSGVLHSGRAPAVRNRWRVVSWAVASRTA